MQRDYSAELEKRTAFIRETLERSGMSGIVFGNSGGKDSALVGILCKRACDNTLGVIMPCGSAANFGSDMDDAHSLADRFGIDIVTIDLSGVKEQFLGLLNIRSGLSKTAETNIAPRLRMVTLYAVAASENRLVAGTGNKSEGHMGYFTKWGDGAFDFNPVADLTVTEIYEFLRFLGAPDSIIDKAPSAGLYAGQTDESEMGISYAAIDAYLNGLEISPQDKAIIERHHNATRHKRMPPVIPESIHFRTP